MKKGLILGAAALATVAFAPVAESAEFKWGGYYRVQGVSGDMTVGDNSNFTSEGGTSKSYAYYRHRLELKLDMIASEKTAAHMVFRPIDNLNIEGGVLGDGSTANSLNANTAAWAIKRLWLETEAAGIKIQAGEMPLQLHKKLMYNDDGNSVGALILSKTFGGVTVLLGNVHSSEGTSTINDNDSDLYHLAALGKAGSISYAASLTYLDGQEANPIATPTITSSSTGDGGTVSTDTSNEWLAVTIGAKLGGIDLDVTGIYESGYDNFDNSAVKSVATEQLADSGFMFGAHLSGSTGFGGWNAYGWYSDENFSSVSSQPTWSQMHNANSPDDGLMRTALNAEGSGILMSAMENSIGIGAELSIKAGDFTIKPGLEYLTVNETDITAPGATVVTKANTDDMVGGWLSVSTSIDTGTTMSLTGAYVDVNANDVKANLPGGVDFDAIHSLVAEIKIVF